jgi:hypothetical protein
MSGFPVVEASIGEGRAVVSLAGRQQALFR